MQTLWCRGQLWNGIARHVPSNCNPIRFTFGTAHYFQATLPGKLMKDYKMRWTFRTTTQSVDAHLRQSCICEKTFMRARLLSSKHSFAMQDDQIRIFLWIVAASKTSQNLQFLLANDISAHTSAWHLWSTGFYNLCITYNDVKIIWRTLKEKRCWLSFSPVWRASSSYTYSSINQCSYGCLFVLRFVTCAAAPWSFEIFSLLCYDSPTWASGERAIN